MGRHSAHTMGRKARAFWTIVAVVLLTAVGFALRWISLDTRGLWLDEAITVYQASQSITGIIKSLVGGVHPPLYHVLVHFWMRAFGRSEVAVRSFSVAVGTLAIPAAFWAGRRLYDRATGLIASGIVALCPCLIWYSQEARMYSLLFLAGLLSTAFLALAIEDNSVRHWIGFGFWTLVGMFTHYFFTFLLIGQMGFYTLGVLLPQYAGRRASGESRVRWWRPWALFGDAPTLGGWLSCHLVIGGAMLAWVRYSVFGSTGPNALVASVQGAGLGYGQQAAKLALRFNQVAAVLVQMIGGFHTQGTMDVLVSLWPLTLTAMFLMLHLMRRSSRRTWLLVWSASGMIVMLLLGQWQQQLLVSRYFLAVLAPAVLIVAVLLAKMNRTAAVITIALVVALWGFAYYDQSYNPHNLMRYDNREALAEVAGDWRPGDVMLFQPNYLFFLTQYYLPSYTKPIGLPLDGPDNLPRDAPSQLAADLTRITASSDRVWLFLSFQDIPAVRSDGLVIQRWLYANGYQLAHDDVLNNVEIQRYDAAPVPASASVVSTSAASLPASSGVTR